MATIFERIIKHEIPSDIVYQDELVTAFRDIQARAPVHILVVPNKPIATPDELTPEDEPAAGRMLYVAGQLAKQEGIAETGYRLIVNCREHGGQEIYHMHIHIVGGRPLGPFLER